MFFTLLFFTHMASAAIPARVEADLASELQSVLGKSTSISADSEAKKSTWKCSGKQYQLAIHAPESEQSAAAYAALRELGFLYPHPRIAIHPEKKKLLAACGKSFSWQPRLKFRGFHLHLEHPNEWVDGFFMGQKAIAEDTLWWLVRNGQNILQLEMVRMPDETLRNVVAPLVQEARALGIKTGLCFSFAMIQQHSYRLIPFWSDFFGWKTTEALISNMHRINEMVPADFMGFELGSSEFTSTSAARTLEWMNAAGKYLHSVNMGMFVKSHVSSNQISPEFGNFNFLPHYASPYVGVEAHTVFFYGLQDPIAPMYGRKNFVDLQKYMNTEKSRRELWYYPETSYWIGMDVDVPIFLTDYLVTRTADVDYLEKQGINGQINFSTGQELGYWLFDWQVALLADPHTRDRPTYALELLGEDAKEWKQILSWQSEYFKRRQLIQVMSTTNLLDELSPFFAPVHDRTLLRRLHRKPTILATEIAELTEAIKKAPSFAFVKNAEIRNLLEVTLLRMRHALALRQAIEAEQDGRNAEKFLEEARKIRTEAQRIVDETIKASNRYPESWIYDRKENPTSYPFGYLWTAKTLFYWEREEGIVREHRLNPFYKMLVNPFSILF